MNMKNSFHKSLFHTLRECVRIIKGVDNKLFLLVGAFMFMACGAGYAASYLPAAADANIKCYGIVSENETIVSLASYEQALNAAERFTKGFTDEEDVIYKNFEIEEGICAIDSIVPVGEAVEILSESDSVVVTYKVETVTEIEMPYSKTIIEDGTLEEGTVIVEQEGEEGICLRTVVSYYENGVETASLAPFAKIEKKPVEEIVRVGTLKGLPDEIDCPVEGTFTSGYGERWGRSHTGIDIGAPIGTPVYAPVSGVVVFAGEKNGYGNYVMIDHGNGDVTAYAHLNDISVSEGDEVKKGGAVGSVGVTGRVTGPHLHFEIIRNGEYINPAPFIKS